MKIIIGILVAVFILINLSYAQTESEHHLFKTRPGLTVNLNNDALSFYKTTTDFFQSPFHFDEKDFILSGIIVGATALSFTIDNSVRNGIRNFHSSLLDKITGVGESFGNGKYVLAISGALYIGGYLNNDNELRKTGLMLAEAIFLNGIVTEGLKIITGRSRPFLNEGNTEIDFFEFEFAKDENSLPSGHTSTAFTVATVLSERINNTYASIALYSLAGLTAFQRIYDDKHWISDTILGATLGTVIGLKIIDLNSEDEGGDSIVKMDITPVVNNGIYGVGIVLKF